MKHFSYEKEATKGHSKSPKVPFLKMDKPWPLFVKFWSFKKHIQKTVGVNGIRTRIVGVEGEHADHLTTTPAQA